MKKSVPTSTNHHSKTPTLWFVIAAVVVLGIIGLLASGDRATLLSSWASRQVAGKTKTIRSLVAFCDSQKDQPTQFKQCWDTSVRQVLRTYSIDDALDMLGTLHDHENEADFGQLCHDLTHIIGQEAYIKFMKNETFIVTPKTKYCNYGFFHGAIEALVAQKGDVRQATKFCDYIDKHSTLKGPDATYHCYHGIGHGTVTVHDTKLWGDERAIVAPAMKICQELSPTPETLRDCGTGIFAGMANFYEGGLYNLHINGNDPLWLCRSVPVTFQEPCYSDMGRVALIATHQDYTKAAKFFEEIPDDTMAQNAFRSLGIQLDVFTGVNGDYTPGLTICRSLEPRLRLVCIQGIVRELVQAGAPGDELSKPLQFCAGSDLSGDEQKSCYDWALLYLRWYSKNSAHAICKTIAQSYQGQCEQLAATIAQ